MSVTLHYVVDDGGVRDESTVTLLHDADVDVAHADDNGEVRAGDDDGDDVHEEVKMMIMMLCQRWMMWMSMMTVMLWMP